MTTQNLPATAPLSLVEKRARLARLLEKRARAQQFPLSFAQTRLWFLDRMQPGSPVYNINMTLRLPGTFDWAVLMACLREIVRRQQSLRTTFPSVDNKPVQQIADRPEVHLPIVDLRGLTDEAGFAERQKWSRIFLHQPFDLPFGPLLRLAVVQFQSGTRLWVSMHHIISDGWSVGVLVHELRALYDAFAAGQASPLPELPIQYADFALWQRQWLQGATLERQLAYWREKLQGATVFELPTDRPRPVVQSVRGAAVAVPLPGDLNTRLAALCQSAGATLFMALLAAFQVLLHRCTDHDDMRVGVPVAGRNRRELEGLIGFFVNMLVLRGDLAGDPTCRELLARTRDAALGAFAHQDIPFEKLVDALQPDRDTSRTPLFQTSFVFQNTPSLPAEQRQMFAAERETAKFDLTLEIGENAQGFVGLIEYNRDLFDRTTVQRLGDGFQRLTAAMAAAPETPIGDLPLLAEAERHQLLAEWNDARPAAPARGTLHSRFAEKARCRPQAVAVSCEDESLTYGELEQRANRLARHLRRLGVGPEARVALYLERSLDMVSAILAVLKAGGAYLPIEPAYPRERKGFLLADSRAAVLLTTAGMRTELPLAEDLRTVLLDPGTDDRAAIDAEDGGDLPEAVSPEHAAYVIYTSGSNGRPKGVLIPHANVVRLFTATDGWFGFGPTDVWTLFHSYAFDFSVWEIWGALLYSGRLVVVPHAVSRSPAELHDLLVRERVTILNQTPPAFRQLAAVDAAEIGGARDGDLALRLVIFGGEVLDPRSLRPWLDRRGDERPRLVNMYGITETTVHVTYRPIAAADLGAAGSPIGGAIPDLALRVLDRALQPVPIGVPGELCVGGAGLARGYLNRPELSAERFVPDPFVGEPGARLYRSGDLARYRADGDLEHLGRIDHQVKVRGFRIELGEIEAEIRRHPAIAQTVVLAVGDGGERRLIAYVVPAPDATPEPVVLREHLRSRLPDYMVPAGWVFLPVIPLTANGKVDRRALQNPEQAAVASAAYVPPQSTIERVIAAVWQEVLGIAKVGLHDNFFELGGHSLLLVQVQARLREQTGRQISMIDLLSHANVSSLARLLTQSGEAAVSPTAVDDASEAGMERAEEGKVRLRQLRRGQRTLVPEGDSYE